MFVVTLILGFLLSFGSLLGVQEKARDTERNVDIKALHGQIEAYYAQNGYYPTLTDINDSGWRQTNMRGLDDEALKDPDSTTAKLVSKPQPGAYSYEVTGYDDANCDNTIEDCTQYTLTATLSDGDTFVKQNLN